MEEFKLENSEFIQLCDLLKAVDWCDTGGQAKIVISEGQVKVDLKVETRKRCKIRIGQIVEFAGQQVRVISP
jgi:ribosome-associated protein